MIDSNTAYAAILSRDIRFDGVFFTGVTSTGIYCRPICPARTPKPEHCRFFDSREAAEKNAFRPCLRCRPELAPGNAPIDSTRRIAHAIARRLETGLASDGASIEDIVAQFAISSRQLRRIVQKEFGTSPLELIQSRRLLLAKQLLTETGLPVIDIAFASGFSSLRRFNDAFRSQYHMPPTRLRHTLSKQSATPNDNSLTLHLHYRPPYDWSGLLSFLQTRRIIGVECIDNNTYRRTLHIGKHQGWIAVSHAPKRCALAVQSSHSLIPVLPILLDQLRNTFDLNARPDQINAHLMQDDLLKPAICHNPGLRVPGTFDGFEMAMRAILGQQITVKAASTLACRFATAFGDSMETPFAELNRLSPQAHVVANLSVDEVASLGIIRSRAEAMIALARAMASTAIRLDAGMNPEQVTKQLQALPGIGPWTAQYIAMRALRWPDAFVKEDVALRKHLGGISARQAEALSQAWRPWRSYAVLHIWQSPLQFFGSLC